MDKRKKLHAYWRKPSKENRYRNYISGKGKKERSEFLVELVKQHIPITEFSSILELGCNVARNLKFLWKAGYRDLTGVDINRSAISIARRTVPKATFVHGTIEDFIKTEKRYNLVFTMAVLMHVRNDEIDLFGKIAAMAEDYIITIESEIKKDGKRRIIGRNYRDIFEDLGFYQVAEIPEIPGMIAAYKGRVFTRRTV